jgi:F-type H+-transporting ATPase subunit b
MNVNATLFGQMLAFGILIWFTLKFVWPPILVAIEERQKKIADGLAAAERATASLKEASTKSDEELKSARQQAAEIIAQANKQAASVVDSAKDHANIEAERIRATAKGELDREIAVAREVLKDKVGELAILGASTILKREVDAKAHADVIGELAAKI